MGNPIHYFYNEAAIDGFTRHDGTLVFFNFVKALYLKSKNKPRVLDFGAGRGFEYDKSAYSRSLRDLRTGAEEVVALDIDEAVTQHKTSDRQIVWNPSSGLPFEEGYFDVIVADYVFEHLTDPVKVCDELSRILKNQGWLCVRTPSKYNYASIAASLVPNKLHSKFLKRIQPEREAQDVFSTAYNANSPATIKKLFPDAKIYAAYVGGEPQYHFNNKFIFAGFLLLHWLLPSMCYGSMMVFIQKQG